MDFLDYLFIPAYFYGTVGALFLLSLLAIWKVRHPRAQHPLPAQVHSIAAVETPPVEEIHAVLPSACVDELPAEEIQSPEEKKDRHAQFKTILRKLHRRHQEKRIGDILVERKIITTDQLSKALAMQQDEKKDTLLGEILTEMGAASEEQIMSAIMGQYHLHYIPLDNYTLRKEVLETIPPQIAWKYLVIPIEKVMKSLTVAMFNPLNKTALQEIESASDCHVVPCLAKPSELRRLVKENYASG